MFKREPKDSPPFGRGKMRLMFVNIYGPSKDPACTNLDKLDHSAQPVFGLGFCHCFHGGLYCASWKSRQKLEYMSPTSGLDMQWQASAMRQRYNSRERLAPYSDLRSHERRLETKGCKPN